MRYKNVGPDFSISATGKKYKHGDTYDEIDIPATNNAWFVLTEEKEEQPLNVTPAKGAVTHDVPIDEVFTTVWDEEDN